MRLLLSVALLTIAAGCADVERSQLEAIPNDALFYVALPEFKAQVPDYRRQAADNIVTERMGHRPRPGQGFALFTYVLGPPGTFAPSLGDETQAPAALEAAIRSDSLMKERSLSIQAKGRTDNGYGTVHWIAFHITGYACAALGQAFDDRAGLHGFLCMPDADGTPLAKKFIVIAADGIVRRPAKDADILLSRSEGRER